MQSSTHRRFNDNFQAGALRALGSIVAYHHLHSKEQAIQVFGSVGEARCGLLRWIACDADIFTVMGNGYFGAKAVLVPTPSAYGQKHIEIISGQFRLLCIHDQDPFARVPESAYAQRAVENNAPLFQSDDQWRMIQENEADRRYTAVLFHCKKNNESIPDVLSVRFPDENGVDKAPPIDLYKMFEELAIPENVDLLRNEAIANSQAPVEVVVRSVQPSVRKKRAKEA